MDPFEAMPKSYDPSLVEEKWNQYWQTHGLYKADEKSDKESFCITLPPPNVTGSLHMGHAMYVVQDVLARFYRMKGKNVLWLPGTDHAGIATQLVVERNLLKEEGKTRHDLSREEFLNKIWEWKETYGHRIFEQMRVLGFSLDPSRARFTMDKAYSAAVIEAFVRLNEEGLLYKDSRLINWCTRCQTALSDLEVDFNEQSGSLWHIIYPLEGGTKQVIVATTRPETLLGDTAVAVHPEDSRYADLIGKKLKLPITSRAIPIIGDKMVSVEFGTGAVKITPGHDFNDFEVGKRHSLPTISLLNTEGKFVKNEFIPEQFVSLGVQQARQKILADLEEQGLLLKTEHHKLKQGCCSRCDTVLEPMISKQWFVSTQPLAQAAIKAVQNGSTTFHPENYQAEFFRWMENIKDWCISRQLVWGHRIPAWYDATNPDKVYVARSYEQAVLKAGHSNLIQDSDVLDTWFSSGLWPFATLGWPNQTADFKTFYPTQVLETGHDILFFWVARMMMLGIYLTGTAPFKKVLLHALVVDENGEKMSKVKGNVIDPLHLVYGATNEAILGIKPNSSDKEKTSGLAKFKKAFPTAATTYPQGFPKQGADALRFFLLIMGAQGRNIRLSIPRIEGYRHFLNKIWSATRFFLMNSKDRLPSQQQEELLAHPEQLLTPERAILSKLQKIVIDTTRLIEEFEFASAAQNLYQFFWYEVCDFYIERTKVSAYSSTTKEHELLSIRTVLEHVIKTSLRLLCPIVPFITEELWSYLPANDGEKLCLMQTPYPDARLNLINQQEEKRLEEIQSIVSAIRTLVSTYQIKGENLCFEVLPSSNQQKELVSLYAQLIGGLAKTQIKIQDTPPHGGKVLVEVISGYTVFLSHAEQWIDIPKEKNRLEKEKSKTLMEKETLENRLQDSNFLKFAKADVVEKDRLRFKEISVRINDLDRYLEALK